MFNEQDGNSDASDLAYDTDQVLDFGGVHPAGRLVEQKKPWLACERAGDLDTTLVNQGQLIQDAVGVLSQADKFKCVLRLPACGVAVTGRHDKINEVTPGPSVHLSIAANHHVLEY